MEGLSVILPVFNEERAILGTIEQIVNIFRETEIPHELIIVNDGSGDKTGKILKDCTLSFTLFEHAQNRGYGASLKTGILASKYDTIAITDADGTYPNERLPEFYRKMDYARMVVGTRSFKQLPNKTKPAKWLINRLANYLANYKIPDINSGFRLYKKGDLMKFFSIIPDGFSFTTTTTLAFLTNGLPVKYIPIEYNKREGKSKIKPVYDTVNFIQLIIRTILYFNPLKIFVPVFFLLLFLAIAVLIGSYFFLPKILDATVIVLFIAAVQTLTIGMIADLIDKRMRM